MRIAYISLHWPRTRNSSVGKKIQRQIDAWRSMGHEVQLFMHTHDPGPEAELLSAEVFPFPITNILQTEIRRSRAAGHLVQAVRTYHPDVIYLRYGIFVFPVQRLCQIAPVIEDVTTNDLIQHKDLGVAFDLYNRLTRGILLRRIQGLVSISHELALSPVFASFRKPTVVIANGIDLDSFQILPAPSNDKPRLVFVGTPTAGFAAHGIDKLIALAGYCPDLHIDIIGYNGPLENQPLSANVTFHGFLPPERYRVLLAAADVAVSSLGFHRIGLEEASPLKSREYLAYGLPMVIPYIDTDLDDLDADVFLKIPNREDNVQTHAQAIHEFAYRMRGRRVDRDLIASRIDTRFKEIKRIEFIEQIHAGAGSR